MTYEWLQHAACRGKTPLFFPEHPSSGDAAKVICAGCPVREECNAYFWTLSPRPKSGIWAGISADSKRRRRVA